MKKKKLKILYEDKDILIVDKPAKLLTVSTSKEKYKTLFHQVFEYVKSKNKHNKVFIVHRLDKDTSGIVVFAKSEDIKYKLQNNWNNIVRTRRYVAIVEGKVVKSGKIVSYLKETKTLLTYSTKDKKNGKKAITLYNPIKNCGKYSLLEIDILTGRKNQIRVHMKDMNHPIIGDKKYGAQTNPIGRLGLHATVLEFYHPRTNELLKIASNIPKDFEKIIDLPF